MTVYLFQVFVDPFGEGFLLNGVSFVWNDKQKIYIKNFD